MLRSKRLWLGVLISGIFLALFLYGIDYPKTGDALRNANYIYVLPAILVYFGSLWFRTIRWQFLLKHLRWMPLGRLYKVLLVGYMANNLLPVRLGEVARSYYLGQRERVSATSTLATIGVERAYDGITLIFFVLVVWPFLPLSKLLKGESGELEVVRVLGSAAVVAVFVIALIVFIAVAVRPELGRRLTDLLLLVVPHRFKGKVRELSELFLGGLESLNSPGKLLIIFVLSVPIWLMEAVMYYLMTFAFDLDVSFALIIVTTATSNLIATLPATSGGIGTFEWATKVTLVSFGVNTEVSVAYAAALHVALWLPVVLAGLIYLWSQHRSLGELARGGPAVNWAERYPMRPVPLEGDGDE
ncbi:MAG: lysylphosphatidylglycerol synthase transmembrane domain-containing protein [Dehalococcoidia bacterium]